MLCLLFVSGLIIVMVVDFFSGNVLRWFFSNIRFLRVTLRAFLWCRWFLVLVFIGLDFFGFKWLYGLLNNFILYLMFSIWWVVLFSFFIVILLDLINLGRYFE